MDNNIKNIAKLKTLTELEKKHSRISAAYSKMLLTEGFDPIEIYATPIANNLACSQKKTELKLSFDEELTRDIVKAITRVIKNRKTKIEDEINHLLG